MPACARIHTYVESGPSRRLIKAKASILGAMYSFLCPYTARIGILPRLPVTRGDRPSVRIGATSIPAEVCINMRCLKQTPDLMRYL